MKFNSLLCSIAAGIAATVSASALAYHVAQHKVVDGVGIYLGVLPAKLVQAPPQPLVKAEMRRDAPTGNHQLHVTVIIFDEASGKRITDAKVTAHVYEINRAGKQKALEPILVSDMVSYGNYFNFPPTDNPYLIRVRIERPTVHGVIETQFEYQHPRG